MAVSMGAKLAAYWDDTKVDSTALSMVEKLDSALVEWLGYW